MLAFYCCVAVPLDATVLSAVCDCGTFPDHAHYFCYIAIDVARTLKKLQTLKGDYWIKQCFSSSVSLFKMGTLKLFALRAVHFGMENNFLPH